MLVSLFGIVNTLVLSIYERTRELGMMRAIGASRRQIRQMIRYESLITGLIGGVLGLVIGVVGALLVTTLALAGSGYVLSIPLGTLVAAAIGGGARGPARSAAARAPRCAHGRAGRAVQRVIERPEAPQSVPERVGHVNRGCTRTGD